MEPDENPPAAIDTQIHVIRGVSVMLDSDLASLYGVSVKALLQAVRRNRKRFPRDFLFPVLGQDLTRLRSQIVTSNIKWWRHRNSVAHVRSASPRTWNGKTNLPEISF